MRFGNTTICFVVILIAAIAVAQFYPVPFYLYPVIIFIYSLILFYGCYYIGSGFFIKIVCSATTDKKEIAITFDDGPAANTPQVLQVLKDAGVKATFFCIGKNIIGNEEALRRIDNDGHIIGNHSYSHHFWFDIFPLKKMLADLQMTDQEVKRVIGKHPKLFRPPYGVTNPTVKKAIINGNYTPVGWSVRSMDTVITDGQKLLQNMTAKLKPGAVFLFHDTSNTTLAMLPALVEQVKQQGYQIVPLDKLLNLQPYA